jgi:hypothetical protein
MQPSRRDLKVRRLRTAEGGFENFSRQGRCHRFEMHPVPEMPEVAPSIVVSAFPMRIRDAPPRELGVNYFDDRRQAHRVDQLTRRIERLGYRVTLEPVTAA